MDWTSFAQRIRHLSEGDQEAIKKAYEMGRKAHEGQTRQSGEPYFNHPVAVAGIMIDLGADRDSIVAALLHDTVEDTPLTLMDIHDAFGDDVATLVDGATKLMEGETGSSTDGKIETLRKIFTYMEKDVRIMVLKLADRLHNMQTLKFRNAEKQRAVAKETLDVYVKIADRLCMRRMRNELADLCYEILEPEVHGRIHELAKENERMAQEKIPMLERKLQEEYPGEKIEMHFKEKSWRRLHIEQALEKQAGARQNSIGVVFLCEDADACYRMLGLLHRAYQREALTFDDFINLPAINGYQALHTTVIMEDGTRIRCKIRTHEMDRYAQLGIATKCFDSKRIGLLDYLPWTKRISPLADDTKDRSEEFWDTLQSDILSESIIVYGPHSSALIPEGATALDAALHLFPEEALRLTNIRINGNEASFVQKVERGSLVEIDTAPERTVERGWLYWVQTGIGIATIRTALGNGKGDVLADSGNAILQRALTERGRGYVEEFDPALMLAAAKRLHYASMEAVNVALAQRRLEPAEFLNAIQQESHRAADDEGAREEKRDIVFRFAANRSIDGIRKLLTVYEKFTTQTKGVRIWPGLGNTMHFRVRIALTPDEEIAYQQELTAAGAQKISAYQNDRLAVALMTVVVFCWGLNPVWARLLLSEGMTPASLVSLRSIIFGVFSAALFVGWRALRKVQYAPIPHVSSLAFLPTVATYLLSFFTYASVSLLPPSVHLTILRFNVVLLPLLHLKKTKKVTKAIAVQLLVLAFFAVLFLASPDIPYIGFPLSIVALVAYIVYSLITEDVLQKNRIGLRYPYFLLHMGMMLAAMGLLFLPWVAMSDPEWMRRIPEVAAYVLVCVFVPHTCFQLILQRTRFLHITSLSLFEVPLGIILETLLLGLILTPYTYGVIVATMVALALLLYRKDVTKVPA